MLKLLCAVRLRLLLDAVMGGNRRRRSRGMAAVYAALLIYLVVALGGMFALGFSALRPLADVGLGWLYFALAGMAAVVLAAGSTILMAQSQLYDARDNELLLSLPIAPGVVLASRTLALFAMDLLIVLVVLVPLIRDLTGGRGPSILTASILLGIMILPTVIGVSESAIRAVPNSYYEGALALGAGHVRSVFFTIVPAAKSGIMAAIILGLGRAVGETMAVIMVAGNQARMPQGLLEGVRTMTTNIVIEMGYAADMHRDALIATAVVLFIFILIINLTFSYLKGKVVQQ